MTDQMHEIPPSANESVAPELGERRRFLLSLGKWSQAVIGGVAIGGLLAPQRAAQAWGWGNRGGGNGSWVNFRGGGWGWRPGWNNWPGRWHNGWFNRPWNNGGWNNWGGWNNRGGWFNGPGWGGSWMNNR